MTAGRRAVIPAAGRGTRLSPLTLGVAKELLPLGAYPALAATLLEVLPAESDGLQRSPRRCAGLQ